MGYYKMKWKRTQWHIFYGHNVILTLAEKYMCVHGFRPYSVVEKHVHCVCTMYVCVCVCVCVCDCVCVCE